MRNFDKSLNNSGLNPSYSLLDNPFNVIDYINSLNNASSKPLNASEGYSLNGIISTVIKLNSSIPYGVMLK